MAEIKRCPWAKGTELQHYHDFEWGIEIHDSEQLFELLMLEAMQSGLSWLTILRKRKHMREVFDNFIPEKIAGYTEEKIQQLLEDPGILRNERKIRSVIWNAKCYLNLKERGIDFAEMLWAVCEGKPKINYPQSMEELPAYDEKAEEMNKILKREGFKFIGPTVCYAFMQSAGMVNDHMVWCSFRNQKSCSDN